MSPRGELQFHFVMKQLPTGLIKKKYLSSPLQSFITIWKITQLGTFSAGREVY